MPSFPSLPRLALGPSLLAAALASGCATPPEPLPAPELISLVSHYAGDPIGGAVSHTSALALQFDSEDAYEVEAELFLLAAAPEGPFDTLSEHTRLILDDSSADPIGASSLVSPGALLVSGARAEALVETIGSMNQTEAVSGATFSGLSFPNVCILMSAVFAQPIERLEHGSMDRRISIHVWREEPDGDAASIALVVTDVVEFVDEIGSESGPELRLAARKETIVLDQPLHVDGAPVVILAPARYDPKGRLHHALVLRARPIDPAGDSGVEGAASTGDRIARVQSEVRNAALDDTERRQKLQLEERLRLRRLSALDAAAVAGTRRAAIVELAGNSGALLASEVALMADDAILEDMGARIAANDEALRAVAGDPMVFGWRLEREMVLLFLDVLADGELAPEYDALLLRLTGEAGRYAFALEDALAASDSTEAFYERIVKENQIALEDTNPGARIRAYDWLVGRGIEIPDYDPLAALRARRAALRALRENEASAVAQPDATEVQR